MKRYSPYLWLFLFVLVVGATLRFAYADLMRFGGEPVKDLVTGARILEGDFIFHGVRGGLPEESRQVTLGPTYYYVIALGLLFANSSYAIPIFPVYVVGLLNLLAAVVCYFFCKDFFSERVGFIAASLFVVAPWNIVHVSNILTPPNLLPLGVMLLMYSLAQVTVKKNDRYLVGVGVFLALITQFHLVAIVMFVPVVLTILILRHDISLKYIFYAVLAFLVVFSPYIIYNLTKGDFDETFDYLVQREESTTSRAFLEALGIPVVMMTPYFGTYMLGNGISLFSSAAGNYFVLFVTVTIATLFGLSLLYTFRTHLLKKIDARVVLLYLWLGIPIFLLGLPGKNLSPHYFIILFPVQFILLALLLDRFYEKYRLVGIGVIGLLLVSSIFVTLQFYRYVDENGGTAGLYESPYKMKMMVVNYIKRDSGGTATVSFYKHPKISFAYLFQINNVTADIRLIQHLDEFTDGYLILDRYSLYSAGEKTLTPGEQRTIDLADKTVIKHFEILKK